jgi:serine phosphatase RsbU (regulator of sigma subunit)
MAPDSTAISSHTMRCMEIRGGSRAAEEALRMPGLDGWVFCEPFEGALSGGDLYYVSLCGGGVISRLIVADVSGHGEQAAEFSDSLRRLMRKNINTKSQTRLVEALNRQFGEAAQSERFATAVVATYLATRQSLTICNAGHPRPLWYRAATKRWGFLDKSVTEEGNLPLGIIDDSRYHQFTILLGRGDVVLFYTDALIEAANPEGIMLGEEGLLGRARALFVRPPERIAPTLLSAIEEFRGGQPARDDLTLLTLYHTASGPRRLSISEKLDVYAKVFGLKGY